jgi:hypothetical protein
MKLLLIQSLIEHLNLGGRKMPQLKIGLMKWWARQTLSIGLEVSKWKISEA